MTCSLQKFLPRCSHFGFFLHVDTFRISALLPKPFGDRLRPSRALLYCVYLLGLHLSGDEALISHEVIYLRRALRQISLELSTALESGQIMHTIQAQVLLAFYLLRTNRFMEADYHVHGAVSLCISIGLHKIRSNRSFSPSVLSVIGDTEVTFSLRGNASEETEKINGFWTVFSLYRLLSIILGNVSNSLGCLDNVCDAVDTPWPISWESVLSVRFLIIRDVTIPNDTIG